MHNSLMVAADLKEVLWIVLHGGGSDREQLSGSFLRELKEMGDNIAPLIMRPKLFSCTFQLGGKIDLHVQYVKDTV